jgi:hypothetical protein
MLQIGNNLVGDSAVNVLFHWFFIQVLKPVAHATGLGRANERGTSVKTADSGGGSPLLHKRRAEGWGYRWLRTKPAECLVLTEDGAAGPNKRKESQPDTASNILRKGWKPDRRDHRLGSRQPGPEGCAYIAPQR